MAYFWSGFSITDFLVKGFDVETVPGFAGLFIGLVSVSILYEGLRALRDFFLHRFSDSRKLRLHGGGGGGGSASSPGIDPSCPPGSGGGGGDGQCDGLRGIVRFKKTSVRRTLSGLTEAHEHETLHEIGDFIGRDREGRGSSSRSSNNRPITTTTGGDEDEDHDDPGVEGRLVNSPYGHCSSRVIRAGLLAKGGGGGGGGVGGRVPRVQDLGLATFLHMIYVFLGYTLMLAVMTFNIWILIAIGIGVGVGYLVFGNSRSFESLGIVVTGSVGTFKVSPLPDDDGLGDGSQSQQQGHFGGGGDGITNKAHVRDTTESTSSGCSSNSNSDNNGGGGCGGAGSGYKSNHHHDHLNNPRKLVRGQIVTGAQVHHHNLSYQTPEPSPLSVS